MAQPDARAVRNVPSRERPPASPRLAPDAVSQHDLRNVLSSLLLVATELEGRDEARLVILSRRIERDCGRVAELVGEPCPPRSVHRPWTLRELLEDVLVVGRALAGPHTSVSGEYDRPIRCGQASCHLFRVLANLVANAVAAVDAQGGGTVAVRARSHERVLLIDIIDDGPGLLTRLSETVSDRSGRRYGGLGLLIAETLLRRLGGALDLVEAGPGGTTLRLLLPLERVSGVDEHGGLALADRS